MFAALGRFTFRRRWAVLAVGLVFVAGAAVWGTGVIGQLKPGGYEDPASPSARAAAAVTTTLGQPAADAVVLFASPDRTVRDPAYRAAVTSALAALPAGLVTHATTYFDTGAPQLVSADRRSTYAVLSLAGADETAKTRSYEAARAALPAPPGLTVSWGGLIPVSKAIETRVAADLQRAETLSLPVLLVLLVVIFGSLVAAGLPLAVGGLGILGAFTALRLISLGTDVSVFALNLVTMLGLGLAVDYALFIVSRFREELPLHASVEGALAATMAHAGRTVAFSGLTVAVSLAGLLLFPQMFLKSMGYGGVAVVLVDVVAALTVLPAMLAVLGRRVDALRVPLPRRRHGAHESAAGAWYRVAHSVMRRPVVYVVVIGALLLGMAAPFLGVRFGGFSAQAVLPAGAEARLVSERLQQDFPGNATNPLQVVVQGPVDGAALRSYATALSAVPGVVGATVTATRPAAALLTVGYSGDPESPAALNVVRAVRAVPPPPGTQVLVGGQSAALLDLLTGLGDRLPWMAGLVALVMVVLLFLAFGSVVLPLKAVVMNALSLGASFGAITWIFQDGHLSGLLGFTSSGTVEATDPLIMLAIIIGLSMDYEVFLLSRMREQWDRSHDNPDAVAVGLQRSGRIITSAALLLVVVIGAFATSGVVPIKMIGVGTAIAIVVDATLVRALLVPATMRLLGRWNWWSPAPLARWWDRFGLREPPAAPVSHRAPEPERALTG